MLSDDITNHLNIKIFSSLGREKKDFADLAHKNAKARKFHYYRAMWIWAFARFFGILLEVGVIFIAIKLRGNGVLELGMIILLQMYVIRIMESLRSIGHTLRTFFRCIAEIGEVVEIINTPHSVVDTTDKKLKITEGEVKFEEVTFAYDEKNPVFDQLSFHIKPGERIGLV